MRRNSIILFIVTAAVHYFLIRMTSAMGNGALMDKSRYIMYLADTYVVRPLFYVLLGAVAVSLHSLNRGSVARVIYLILGIVLAGVYGAGAFFYFRRTRNMLMIIYSFLSDSAYTDFGHAVLALIGALFVSAVLAFKRRAPMQEEESEEEREQESLYGSPVTE